MTVKGKSSRLFTVLVFAMLAMLWGIMNASPAIANQACVSDAFLIAGLDAEAEASTGNLARQIATENALEKAWQILLNRLVIDGQDNNALQSVNPSSLLLFTRLDSETVLTSRYIAKLDYCFDRQMVRELFRENNIAYAELLSDRIMVLPIFISGGRATLWQQPNPWKRSVESILPDHNGLVQLAIPSGFAIERSITGQGIMDQRASSLKKAVELDPAAMMLVSTARVTLADNGIALVVTGELYNRDGEKLADMEDSYLPMASAEQLPEQLNQMANEMVMKIEQVWRQANLVDLNAQNVLRVSVGVISLDQWFSLLAKLEGLSPVEQIDLRQLSADAAVLDMTLNGSREALDYALEQAGYRLDANPNAAVGGYLLLADN